MWWVWVRDHGIGLALQERISVLMICGLYERGWPIDRTASPVREKAKAA